MRRLDQPTADAPTADRAGRRALDDAVRVPLLIVATAAALVAFVVGMVVAGTATAVPADLPFRHFVTGLWPEAGQVAYVVDFLGDARSVAVLTTLLAAACLVARRPRSAAATVVAVLVTGVLATGLKPLADRTIHGDNLSYPSGHVAMVTVLGTAAALAFVGRSTRSRVTRTFSVVGVALLVALGMALDQVALDAHYPSDALGGTAIAIAVAIAAAAVTDVVADRVTHRGEPPPPFRPVTPRPSVSSPEVGRSPGRCSRPIRGSRRVTTNGPDL